MVLVILMQVIYTLNTIIYCYKYYAQLSHNAGTSGGRHQGEKHLQILDQFALLAPIEAKADIAAVSWQDTEKNQMGLGSSRN